VIELILSEISAVKSPVVVPRFDDIVLTVLELDWQTISDETDHDVRAI
jgi:hypothetical protein